MAARGQTPALVTTLVNLVFEYCMEKIDVNNLSIQQNQVEPRVSLLKAEPLLTKHIKAREFARLLTGLMRKAKDSELNLQASLAISNYRTMYSLTTNDEVLKRIVEQRPLPANKQPELTSQVIEQIVVEDIKEIVIEDDVVEVASEVKTRKRDTKASAKQNVKAEVKAKEKKETKKKKKVSQY